MVFARAVVRGSAVVAALALTSACLPGDGDGGGGGGEPESTAKGGQQLTEEQATSALPTKEQLPAELTVDETEDSPRDPESTSYPATCRDVELDGEEGRTLDTHVRAKTSQNYSGDFGGVVSVTVVSHDTAVPGELFDAAGAAQSTCAEFTKIDKQGTTKWAIEPATLPPMGDRTYVVGLEMLSGDKMFVGGKVQLAGVSLGHNLVYIVYSAAPESQLSTQVVEEMARTTVDNLEEL
ncbi:hypothetical protein [Janibacter sp. GS2]|uniref:hypothetical protein n=1 Tax=Janibacter sp. GS2 TaxID=3442646 RepID=UPI003EB82587